MFRSYAVIILALVMVMTALLIMLITEPGVPVVALLFEITSAFGTCGMSLGITSDLSVRESNHYGADVYRAGWAYFIPLYIRRKYKKPNYHFPKERVIIG